MNRSSHSDLSSADESGRESTSEPSLRRLGRYELIGELGRGAMGAVYRAYDPNIDREVAIKVIRPWMATHQEQTELQRRFLAEVRAAGRLRHPGVVGIYDADRDHETGLAFLAMELIEGCSLDEVLGLVPRLEAGIALTLGYQVADAIDTAHRAGIVHRDIKPQNLLIDASGTVKLSDFGIVRIGEEEITATGQVLGTPAYMSPEQLLDEQVGAATDVWAFGAVLFRALTGMPPFASESLGSLAYKIVHDAPRSPELENPQIPPAMSSALLRALEKRPEDRFATALELMEALGERVPHAEARAALGGLVEEVGSRRPEEAASRELYPPSQEIVPRLQGTPQPSQVMTRKSHEGSKNRGLLSRWLLASMLLVVVFLAGGALMIRFGPGTGSNLLPGDVRSERSLPKPAAEPPENAITATALEPPSENVEGSVALELQRARVRLSFKNRLRKSVVTVRLDGDMLWQRTLEGRKNVFRRVFGTQFSATLEIPPGDHELEVSVQGVSMKVESRAATRADFAAGSYRDLKISLNPYTERLSLEWQ